jgi:formylglycine-generating enzyme required for sulfatase activity
MAIDIDAAVGQAAVGKGYITQQQLDDCIRVKEMVTQAGLTRSLAEILVEKGFITQMQAEVLQRSVGGADVQVIGGYELVQKIGEGGMGAVYKAHQISMDRDVALKLLPDRLAKDKEFTARFLREARVAAKLDHVNVVRGIDVGQDGEYYYFAMEFVEGESVAGLLKREGKIAEAKAISITIQVARALQHAESLQLIHRDIKPDNILLTTDGVAKMADLGLARSTSNESTVMTRTGMAVGTPHYISPEQARGEKNIDIRTDIYSLGATLYHMAVGDTPFAGSTAAVIITQHLTENPAPACARNPEVSEQLSRVIAKMMAKDPSERYLNPAQLLEDLELVADKKDPKHAGAIIAQPSGVPTMQVRSSGLSSGASLISAAQLQQFESQMMQAASRKWMVPVAVGGGVLGVLVIVLVVLLLAGGSGLEEQAATDLASVKTLVAMGKLDAAHTDAIKGATKYAQTSKGDSFAALIETIEAKVKARAAEEEQKRKDEEAAKVKAAQDALAQEALTVLDRASSLLGEKKYADARGTLDLGHVKIREAGLDKEETDLRARIAEAEKADAGFAAQQEKAKREAELKAAEDERQRRFDERVKLGDTRLAERSFAAALEAYQAAGDIKSTPELERKILDCRFESAIAEGKAAQEREELVPAAEWYRKALGLREDAAVRARLNAVLDTLKRSELEPLLAKINGIDASKATDEDEIKKALAAAKDALKIAGEKETADLQAHAKALEAALKYAVAMEEARAAVASSEWTKAKAAAMNALSARPGDTDAQSIIDAAQSELTRPRELKTSLGIEMAWVRGGEFIMGSEDGDDDERPTKRVRLKGFFMGKTEITNAQYEKFDPPHAKKRGKYSRAADDPVVNVTWRDAIAFCKWLTRNEGRTFRLPTEAEWEYAARGTDGRSFPWGDEPPSTGTLHRANFGEGDSAATWKRDGFTYTAPVGSFPSGSSPFGIVDMAGNVWEWCTDWYGPYPIADGVAASVSGPASGSERVLRGGSWYHDTASMRCANRWSKEPDKMSSSVGFRVVGE